MTTQHPKHENRNSIPIVSFWKMPPNSPQFIQKFVKFGKQENENRRSLSSAWSNQQEEENISKFPLESAKFKQALSILYELSTLVYRLKVMFFATIGI